MPSRLVMPVLLSLVVSTACSSAVQPGEGATGLPESDHVHALRATDDGALLLGLHGALWRSEDGMEWEQLGLEGQDAMALGVAKEGEPLLIGGHDVLVRSVDGGETFDDLSPADLPSLDIHALAQAPSDPLLVYAYVVGVGLFRSEDAGDSWELAAPVDDALPGDLAAMAVDPRDPDVVLVGSGSQGVFRSEDGGRTFARTTEWGSVGLGFSDDGTVVAATYRGVDVSADGGQSWENVAPAEDFDGQPFAVAIGNDGVVWVMTEKPRVLLRSGDGGATFDEVARA